MKRFVPFALVILIIGISTPVRAQDKPGAKLPVREVVRRLTQSTGRLIVADRTLANAQIALELKGGPIDAALHRLEAALPEGAQIRKVLLPAFKPGVAPPDGDQVSALVDAQDALLGPVSGAKSLSPGEHNVLGKALKEDQVKPAIDALNLKVVYLITNPRLKDDPVIQANQLQNEMLRRFLSMTPEQQSAMFDQQWDSLMTMDPTMRRALLQQQLQASMGMMQKIQKMPADQRQRFMDDIRQALPPGFGAPGPGGR